MKKKLRFQRSVEKHIEYYRGLSIKEKLKETLEISEFCRKLAKLSQNIFHGKQ